MSRSLPFARIFERGADRVAIAYDVDGVVEQIGDEEPRKKALVTPEAILRAVDKAIDKRIAAGFVETTPPLPEDVAPVGRLDDAALALIHPLRRLPGLSRGVDPARAWGVLAGARKDLADYLREAPMAAEPEALAEVEAAVAWLGSTTPTAPPSAAVGAMATFLMGAHASRAPQEAIVDLAVWGGDVALATEVLVGLLRLCAEWPLLPIDDDARRQQPGANFAAEPGPFYALRAHLARAAEGDYERARRVAEQARCEGTRELRVALAYAFPDVPAWSHEEARAIRARIQACMEANTSLGMLTQRGRTEIEQLTGEGAPERWLLTSATDTEVLYWLAHDLLGDIGPLDLMWRGRTAATAEVLGRGLGRDLMSFYLVKTLTMTPPDDVPLSMIAVAGEAALGALGMLHDRVGCHQELPPNLAPTMLDAIGRALARLPSDEAIDRAIGFEEARAHTKVRHGAMFAAVVHLAELAPRRALEALRRRYARSLESPLLVRLGEDLARRIEGAAPFERPLREGEEPLVEPTTPLGAALVSGDIAAIAKEIAEASVEDLERSLGCVRWDELTALVARNKELLEAIERRFQQSWAGVRLVADAYLDTDNPQFQASTVASFLEGHDHAEAFAYAVDCLRFTAMVRELDDALEAHCERAGSASERALRVERVMAAAVDCGEDAYAERWRART